MTCFPWGPRLLRGIFIDPADRAGWQSKTAGKYSVVVDRSKPKTLEEREQQIRDMLAAVPLGVFLSKSWVSVFKVAEACEKRGVYVKISECVGFTWLKELCQYKIPLGSCNWLTLFMRYHHSTCNVASIFAHPNWGTSPKRHQVRDDKIYMTICLVHERGICHGIAQRIQALCAMRPPCLGTR
jgi:hypothetical protein